MTWRVVHACFIVAKRDGIGTVVRVHGRRLADLEPEHRPLLDRHVVEKLIVAMEVDGDVERVFGGGHAGDVIDVSVRQKHGSDLDVEVTHGAQQLIDLIARVNEHRLAGARASHHKTVLVERRHGSYFENHRSDKKVRLKADTT